MGLFLLAMSLGIVIAIVGKATADARGRRALVAAFREDREVRLLESPSNVVALRSVGARVVEARARADQSAHWFIIGYAPRIAGRTSLRLDRMGVGDQIGELVGVHDVQTNVEIVDHNVRIRGSDADVVRGIVCVPEVAAAIGRLFLQQGCSSVDISLDIGRVTMSMRAGVSAEAARAVVHNTMKFLDTLEEHAEAPARADIGSLGGGVGAGSGTPFVIPLGDRR